MYAWLVNFQNTCIVVYPLQKSQINTNHTQTETGTP